MFTRQQEGERAKVSGGDLRGGADSRRQTNTKRKEGEEKGLEECTRVSLYVSACVWERERIMEEGIKTVSRLPLSIRSLSLSRSLSIAHTHTHTLPDKVTHTQTHTHVFMLHCQSLQRSLFSLALFLAEMQTLARSPLHSSDLLALFPGRENEEIN